jgi:hypothetical protein
MSSFTPRLTVPANNDPHYTRIASGGLNPCIPGIPEAWTGSVLANCVGYNYGRWYEILGRDPQLYTGDAKYWWSHNSQYVHGSEPRLGAIICFDSASQGHVAIVEQIIDANTIVTSNSAYQQTIFYTQTLRRANNWTWNSNFTFQGFIYLPSQPISRHELLAAIAIKRRKKGRRI